MGNVVWFTVLTIKICLKKDTDSLENPVCQKTEEKIKITIIMQ